MTATWAKHYQNVWEERSGSQSIPKWLRVASLCYGMHKANGHAAFAPGEVAAVLGTVDTTTGEILPDLNADRAVKTAIKHGFLARGSTVRCLMVSGHAVGGPHGNEWAPCPVHGQLAVR